MYIRDGKRKNWEQTDETADFYRFNFDARERGRWKPNQRIAGSN